MDQILTGGDNEELLTVEMNKKRVKNRGVTLLELLVAITLSGYVLALGTTIYIKSVREFHKRVQESDQLRLLSLVDRDIEKMLREEIGSCNRGELTLSRDGEKISLNSLLTAKHKSLKDIRFQCYEADSLPGELVEWKTMPQPQLVEYSGEINLSGSSQHVFGSLVK